jgi:hypothetical protein
MLDFDRSKSLQELDGEDWSEPNFDSHLVVSCHRLRRLPVRDLSAGDLRMLIGQQIGLRYLVPVALGHLQNDPLTEGDYYPGDLLTTVLRADSCFWLEHAELRRETDDRAQRAFDSILSLDESDRKTTQDALQGAYDVFVRAEYFAKHGRC